MATGVASWSQTASSNSTSDANVNWAEGQAPSSVNDSARAMMASVAKWRDDIAGSLTTGGTLTAYTVTTNQGFASLSAMDGQMIRAKFHAANGASATLNVDSLGAKSLVTVAGTAIGSGAIPANAVVDLVYDNANTCWVVVGSSVNTFPSGTGMLFQQTAAPTGWTKATTHDNKAIRLVTGTVTSGGSGAFTTVFASRTIAQANLPNVSLTTTITDNGHTHGVQYNVGTFTSGAGQAMTALVTSGGATSSNTSTATTGITASTALGGSGTAMDFAVQYVDVILALKN